MGKSECQAQADLETSPGSQLCQPGHRARQPPLPGAAVEGREEGCPSGQPKGPSHALEVREGLLGNWRPGRRPQ